MHASPHLPSRRAALRAGAAALLPLQRAGAQEPLEKVKLGSLRFVSSGAVFIALERGYFKDEGLDVAITF
ncbi:MAG: ABC transporter substrate-binding protein, partial [Hyphomicrobiales bacterium]|nr:ABC transporter substrate-binding protein [Hyphomicrobiales bacterium]